MRDVFISIDKVCATCGKKFQVICPSDYTYKIKSKADEYVIQWYCGYTHWIEECRKREKQLEKNRKNCGGGKKRGFSQNV